MAQTIPHSLTVIQHNVRNWSTVKHGLVNTYTAIDPDIILLNSHGIKTTESINITNYKIYKSNKTNERNDGVAIAIKKNIRHILLDNYTSETLAVKLHTTQGEIIIATTYLPPRRPFLPANDFLNLLNNKLPVYILGDLNAKHRILGNNNNNNVGKSLFTLVNEGKAIHIGPNFKTYIGRHSLTNPDKIIANTRAHLNHYSEPGPLTASDHIPIIFRLSTSPIQIPVRPRLAMSKANWMQYQEDLATLTPINLNGGILEDIDDAIDTLHNKIKYAVHRNIPTKRYKTLPHINTTETLRQIQTLYTQTLTTINNTGPTQILMHNIHVLQENISEECLRLKAQMWDDMITNIKQIRSPKEFWKNINRLQGNKTDDLPHLVDQTGNKLYTDQEKERALRAQWKNIFKISEEENENYDAETEEQVNNYLQNNIHYLSPDHTIDFNKIQEIRQITADEILHHLRKFKEKAPGPSGITRNMLINMTRTGFQYLEQIFNACLATGYYPDNYKTAKMIAVPKQGKHLKYIENYRPISLLEVSGKLLEKIINKRITEIFEQDGTFNNRHHGFRKNRSTQTAIALITEQIAIAKTMNQQATLVLRDVSKAFDKVWHHGLIYKILHTNLHDSYKKLLIDYIQDRHAVIHIGNHTGQPFPLLSGVPQGGCLSPTLYILYTTDMPQPTPYSDYIVYADDISQLITYPGTSKNIMASHTATAIKSINDFENKWKIKTNMQKFTVIPIATRNPAPLLVDGDIVQYSNQGSLLGLKITRTGYKKHVTEKIIRLKDSQAKMYRFKQLSTSNKTKLYLALQRSVIEYPPIPESAYKKTNIRKLQIIQNKALRFIYNINYPDRTTNEELHTRAQLPTINNILHQRAKNIWENIKENLSETFSNKIEPFIPQRTHAWFSRTTQILDQDPPPPMY